MSICAFLSYVSFYMIKYLPILGLQAIIYIIYLNDTCIYISKTEIKKYCINYDIVNAMYYF